ncbi:MAG: AIPR family protein [Chloroflexi bacterium]|nr:AIPR family protein [Chloroflexota bacterium]
MSRIQVNHIKQALDNLFTDKIDLTDIKAINPEEIKKQFYSRALAAYALHIIASSSIEDSANSITDDYNDNGIDAIYYDEQQNILYLVQSKKIDDGTGEPDTGEMRKFTSGITELIEEKYERFNKKVQNKLAIIKEAFGESQIKLNIILSYTGKGFAIHNQRIINDLVAFLNESTEWAFFSDFNLKSMHDSLNTILAGKPIESEISLSNWGTIDEPYNAYYGQISAYDLAVLWKNNRKKLFAENIRNFIGLSDINSGILRTIENEPENFIYFNNGVTILCKSIKPLPARTVGKTTGLFDCKSLSIINGAQTVGSLGIALDKFPDKLQSAKVFVRLIPLENSPENFGNRITISSNTQNKIEKRDFVTLDQEQQRLKTELLLSGINYHYKRTDEVIPFDENNCSLEEATVALACASKETAHSVTAKREIGRLWDDISKVPYKDLFNEQLKVHKLWRCIKIYRAVSKFLSELRSNKTSRERAVYTYGNYFILHVVINKVPAEILMNPVADFDSFFNNNLSNIIESATQKTYELAESAYPTALIHQLFRNYTKCKDLREKIDELI